MFTLFHVVVSLIGIVAGLVVAGGLASGRLLGRWAEPPFAITQVLVLLLFVWLGIAADRGFRASAT